MSDHDKECTELLEKCLKACEPYSDGVVLNVTMVLLSISVSMYENKDEVLEELIKIGKGINPADFVQMAYPKPKETKPENLPPS